VLEIQVLIGDGHSNVAGLHRLMGSQPSPLDNWISNGNIQSCIWGQILQKWLPLKTITHHHKNMTT
jgi:hypothetical protein